MQIPSDLIPINKWKAFKGNFPPDSPMPHSIIIIYHSAEVIHYFYVTSQIDKVKEIARYDIGSIAEINPNDWNELTKDSCVQCNKGHLHQTTEQRIKEEYDKGEVKYLGLVPEIVKDKIINATRLSKTFTDTEKRLYTLP